MVPCIDPAKPGVAGLKEKVFESLGNGLEGVLDSDEFKIRKAGAVKLYSEFQPYKEGMPLYPNFGPHPETPAETQHAVFIPKASVVAVLGKIFRGAEYKLNNKRLIQSPYKLEVFEAVYAEIPDVEALFNRFSHTQHFGPGFRLERVAPGEVVLYKAVIWDTWTAYGSIDFKE